MEKKITKAEKFAMLKAIPAVAENEMLVEFIEHEMEILSKKNSERHETAQQRVNAEIGEKILEHLRENYNKLFTITEMSKEIPVCKELTNQKITSIVSKLKREEKVECVKEGKKSFYKIMEQSTLRG